MFRAVSCIALMGLAMQANGATAPSEMKVPSPDGKLVAIVRLSAEGSAQYWIERDGAKVLQESKLGVVREDADFTRGLEWISTTAREAVNDRYEMLTSKRRLNTYRANRQSFQLKAKSGQRLDIIFQVSDDGVGFRYRFPEASNTVHRIKTEATSFNFLPGTLAWLQPLAAAKTGFGETNPSYEETYERQIAVGTRSPTGAGWAYPALFRSDQTWLLISETALGRNYAGTRLDNEWRSTEYTVRFPEVLEHFQNGPVAPKSTLPWLTPWRLIVIGDLRTIAESTLGTDLADAPQASAKVPEPGPGKASWSWPLMGDDHTNYDTSKRFIDYAAEMGWKYTLIDALWDTQIGDEKMKELVDYARSKNVSILAWYNSAGDWNTAPQTPRGLLLTREDRLREFKRMKEMGVVGLKVDFWPGDGQSAIAYYHDMLEDSAKAGLLMNFHGSTLPRGWHRTYPHLMTMEAIKGLEFVTFDQKNAEDEPTHAAMLPFTRNVFEPMDFTPVVLDRIRNIERRTSSAFELALSVLFTSGIQHYAEIPEGMAKAPIYVRDFMKAVPSVWDDVKFIDASPGEYVVIARRAGKVWYVAGINAQRSAREVRIDLRELAARGGTVITDGADAKSFTQRNVDAKQNPIVTLTIAPRGGFVLTTN